MPNTTQVPNHIIDELLPMLGDTEFKVLLVIARQTLGWVEDPETGRRKDRDWISNWQMQKRTGRGHTQVSKAIKRLIEEYHLIEAFDADGGLLDTSHARQIQGGQIFYRLKTREPSLFDKPPKSSKTLPETGKGGEVTGNRGGRKPETTKQTPITKENTMQSALPIASEPQKATPAKEVKTYSPHKQFVDFFYRNARKARGFSPVITGMDAKNLKRVLDHGIQQDTLEKAALYFLHEPSFKKFAPSMSTFLSAGVINGILTRMKNEPEFWKKLDRFIGEQGGIASDPKQIATFADQLAALKHRLAEAKKMPFVPHAVH